MDRHNQTALALTAAIHSARERVWLQSPYFVPDEALVSALQLAALRGVDVRILLPQNPDHWFVWMASFHFITSTALSEVKFYHYKRGFLHSKTILVDQTLAGVGTANLDYRSFRLNFEITAFFSSSESISAIERMFREDLEASIPVGENDFARKPLLFRLTVRIARLFAPLL